jgi:beta-lactamase regulating signal transducer with metallopeptidase domain
MSHVDPLYSLFGRLAHSANVLLEWLITYAIHSSLLIGGLLLLTATVWGRRFVAGNGTWLWRFALFGAVLTSSLQSIRSTAPLTGTLRLDRDTTPRTIVRLEVNRAHAALVSGYPASNVEAVVHSSIKVTPVWPLIVLGGWLTMAGTMLTWFLVARARFLRSIGPRLSADHTLAGNALRYLQREGRITRPIRLTTSDRLTSPVALGSDEICLPFRALSELDPVRMESIVAHELAHLVRRDPSWLTAARVLEALFFFQPLNIVARRRMQESAEFASDAWASMRVTRPLDLAHCLARVAEWTIAAPRLPVPAMAERRGPVLVRRVERLTTGRVVMEETPGRAARLMAAMALLALILLAPRAAIGAEFSAGRFFNARVPAEAGVLMFERMDDARSSGERKVEAVMVRVRGQ